MTDPDPSVSSAPAERCANCNAVLRGEFCHLCGQSTETLNRYLGSLLSDLLGGLFNYDSRVYRTLIPLLFRPGFVCREYLAGRRVRYLPPFRLYLFSSLLFFLIITVINPLHINRVGDDVTVDVAGQIPPETMTESEGGTKRTSDDAIRIELPGFSAEQNEQLSQKLEDFVRNRPEDLMKAIINNLPTTLFVLLPILALALKLLYPFSGRYYLEHLIYVLYSQSFAFLYLLLALGLHGLVIAALATLPGWTLAEAIGRTGIMAAYLWMPIYLFLMQRRVYGQSCFGTFVKFCLLSLAYIILMLLTILAAFILSLIF